MAAPPMEAAPAVPAGPPPLDAPKVMADKSDKTVFTDSDGAPADQQLYVAAELIYSF